MKRVIGRALVIIGTLIVVCTLGWVAAYFVERGLDHESLLFALTSEFPYWAPALLLGLPAVVLIQHGRRLLVQDKLPVLAVGEVAIIFAILGILAALVMPLDNFSYVAASIVANGIERAQPARVAIERYREEHGEFPDADDQVASAGLSGESDSHIRSILLGSQGRIIITFDTQDLDWKPSWWQRLLMMESNDLTGKTLVLVPAFVGGEVVWDECEEGTVPKRNRHFKCSGHQ
ncbi:MAG: hypothetical protein D9N11_13735 [Ketobacter sp.]|nr:MAG: hypothetical protein D9N11_13735 [Ketobacter sp.]